MDQNERTVGAARPEYVDFDVDGFPGGLPACLEAVLMVCDQPQQAAVEPVAPLGPLHHPDDQDDHPQ